MIKEKLKQFVNWLKKSFKRKETIISCAVAFLSFSLIFPAGLLSNETKDEICAEYYSQIASKYTIGGGDKKLSGLIVEPKPGHNVSMAYDTQTEINNIWGAFKGEDASFAPVVNANKEVDIHFVDIDFSNSNLSILYSSLGGSTEPYHQEEIVDEETKEKKKITVDYKFQCSPLAAMFDSSRSGPQSQLKIYISQKQAEKKLKSLGVEKIDLVSLYSLIGKETDIVFDGELRTCVIDNIFLDNFEHEYTFPSLTRKYNYYYGTDVGSVIGDFIFISTYALNPGTIFPDKLVKQGMYFMSEHSYRNRFYLEYARDCYSPADYSFKYATANLKSGFVPDDIILQKAVNAGGSNVGCALLTTFLSLMFAANLIFIILFRLFMSPLSLALIGVSSIVPYLLFRIIFAITKNVSIFSSYSTILNLVLLIVLAISMFVLVLFTKAVKKKEVSNA